MPKITLDFSSVGGELIPEGHYEAVIDTITHRQSKGQTDGPGYLNWQFSIIEGEFVGVKVWMMTSLSPKAAWRLYPQLKALGLQEKVTEIEIDEATSTLIHPDLTGKQCLIEVIQEDIGNGSIVNKVENIVATPDGEDNANLGAGQSRRLF